MRKKKERIVNKTFVGFYKTLDKGAISQLSRKCKISRQQLYNYLTGECSPSILSMEAIEQATDGKVPFASWKPERSAVDDLL